MNFTSIFSRLKYQYYIQLRQIDPTLKDDFKFDTVDELFQGLNQKIIDIKLLEKVSSDFDWNYQKILCTQVSSQISIHFSLFYPNKLTIFVHR